MPLRINTVGERADNLVGFGKKKMGQFIDLLKQQHGSIPYSRKVIQPDPHTLVTLKTDGTVNTLNIVTSEGAVKYEPGKEEWATEYVQVPVPVIPVYNSGGSPNFAGYLCASGMNFSGPWVFAGHPVTSSAPPLWDYTASLEVMNSSSRKELWMYQNTELLTPTEHDTWHADGRIYTDIWTQGLDDSHMCQKVTVWVDGTPYDTWLGYKLSGHGSTGHDKFYDKPDRNKVIFENDMRVDDYGASWYDCYGLGEPPVPTVIYSTLTDSASSGSNISSIDAQYGDGQDDYAALMTRVSYTGRVHKLNFYLNPFMYIDASDRATWEAAGGVWPQQTPTEAEWLGTWDNPWNYEIEFVNQTTYGAVQLTFLSGGREDIVVRSIPDTNIIINGRDVHLWNYSGTRIGAFSYKVNSENKVYYGIVDGSQHYEFWLDPWYEQTGGNVYHEISTNTREGEPLNVVGSLPDNPWLVGIQIGTHRRIIKHKLV